MGYDQRYYGDEYLSRPTVVSPGSGVINPPEYHILNEIKSLLEENKHLKRKIEGLEYRLKHAYDMCYCYSSDPQDNPGENI